MRFNTIRSIAFICIAFLFSLMAAGQTAEQRARLLEMAETFSARFEQEKSEAVEFANRVGIPVRQELEDGTVIELMRLENGRPVYYITHNAGGATMINTDKVYPDGSAGLSLTGSGQTLGIWDGGKVRDTHQELTGRVIQQDGATSLSHHATHVAGTMIASGVVSSAKGMSYAAQLDAYDWNSDQSEMATAAANGLKVSQHSYGYLTGWALGSWSGNSGWHWWGLPNVAEFEDHYYGFYDNFAQEWDEIAFNAPNYLIVKSAGNDRGTGPASGAGHYVRNPNNNWNWEYSTTPRQINGGADGYDCISRNGNAKNIMTVGAVTSSGVLALFTSWGPTDDGRVKPDIVAKGVSVESTGKDSDDHYYTSSGTSMSAPMISGSVGLLLQHQENLHPGVNLLSSTIKALIIHTADDMISGAPGPDYRFGWGLMDTEAAARVMSDNASANGIHIYELTLSDGKEIAIPVKSIGNEPLRATIVWTDVPGTPPPASLNPTDLMLVNDLDMRLMDMSAAEYAPYILDPANPSLAATTGDNFRDNVEVINIDAPGQDEIYLLTITHKGSLTGGSQQFSLIITGNQDFEWQEFWQASDQASNYDNTWIAGDNQGVGYESWNFIQGGAGGSYLGATGLGAGTFGIYSGGDGAGDFFTARRDLQAVMPVSSTFSVDLGYTNVATNGEIGLNLFSGNNFRLNLKFVGGASEWVLNDGGSDFGTGIPWSGNTPLSFAFTRHEGNQYSLQIVQDDKSFTANNYTATSGEMAIDRIEFFSSQQGSGNNLGFNHLAVEPELPPAGNETTVILQSNFTLQQHLEVENLIIRNNHQLVLEPGVHLTVKNELSNQNTGAKSGDGLLIQSNASSTASLIHSTPGVEATVERYIAGASDWSGEAIDWHFLAAPVIGQAISGNWTPSGAAGDYDFYAWDEAQAEYPWRNQKDGSNGITHFTDGAGYLSAYEHTGTKQFSGELHAGTVTVTLQRQGTQSWKGYNLLGNPYPSAIDWHLADRSNFADDFAYIYDRSANSGGGGYVYVDGGYVDALIPAHQGFFVLVGENSNGASFSFDHALKKHGSSFMKSSGDQDMIVLKLSNEAFSDKATIRIDKNSSFARDRYDAVKMNSFNRQVPHIYSLTDDNRSVAVNTIPAVNETVAIPVSLQYQSQGMMTISADDISGAFEELPVVLYDLLTDKPHNLKENPAYTFFFNPSDDPNRFILMFEAVGIDEANVNESIQIWSHGHTINLLGSKAETAIISVYNITGQRIYNTNMVINGHRQLTLDKPAGWYLIQLIAGDEVFSRKVFLF